MIGIYIIKNKINGKSYVGQSRNIPHRWADHRWSANNKETLLTKDFRKYGIDNFEFIVLEKCPLEMLDSREIYYIEKIMPEYNVVGGGKERKGFRHSEETKKILSRKSKEQWDQMSAEERKQRIINNLKGPTIGKPRSEETKQKLREAALKQFKNGMPSETKRKISIANSKAMIGNCNRKRAVAKLDSNGNVIEVFRTAKEAALNIDRHPAGITKVCTGKKKKCGGFGWKYCD